MDIRIETPRLVLRPWGEEDVDDLARGLDDLRLARWLAFVPHPYSTADAADWIRRCRRTTDPAAPPTSYEFAVALRPEGALIGGVSLSGIDWAAGTGGGGVWIAGPRQGRGYGREAFAAKIRFAFRELGLARLVNGYFDGNDRSWAMQRALGYRRVGAVPRRCMADGRQTVEHVTMLLRGEWEDREARPSGGA